MRLNAITANRHIFDGRVNGKPIRFRIEFEGGNGVRLHCASDGWRMTIDDKPLDEPFDMREFGRIDYADVTHELFPSLLGKDVRSLNALQLWGEHVGLSLRASDSDNFNFWNDGDEFYWGDDSKLTKHDWLDGEVPKIAEDIRI